jgi:hypothetical protein
LTVPDRDAVLCDRDPSVGCGVLESDRLYFSVRAQGKSQRIVKFQEASATHTDREIVGYWFARFSLNANLKIECGVAVWTVLGLHQAT